MQNPASRLMVGGGALARYNGRLLTDGPLEIPMCHFAINPNVPPEVLSGSWDLAKMVLTAVFAVLTFIAGQIFMKLAEPALLLRGYIGIINGDLLMYANKAAAISTPRKRMILYRKHAAKLHELLALIIGYEAFSLLLGLPSKEAVREAAAQLIGLSNTQVTGSGPPLGDWYHGRYIQALLGVLTLTEADRTALTAQKIQILAGI
jgi:hypothetical protein